MSKPSETGKQHPAERFTGPSRPQNAVSNVTFWTLETWKFQAQRVSEHVLEGQRNWHQQVAASGSAGTTLFLWRAPPAHRWGWRICIDWGHTPMYCHFLGDNDHHPLNFRVPYFQTNPCSCVKSISGHHVSNIGRNCPGKRWTKSFPCPSPEKA